MGRNLNLIGIVRCVASAIDYVNKSEIVSRFAATYLKLFSYVSSCESDIWAFLEVVNANTDFGKLRKTFLYV
jgi:hypothetical protein